MTTYHRRHIDPTVERHLSLVYHGTKIVELLNESQYAKAWKVVNHIMTRPVYKLWKRRIGSAWLSTFRLVSSKHDDHIVLGEFDTIPFVQAAAPILMARKPADAKEVCNKDLVMYGTWGKLSVATTFLKIGYQQPLVRGHLYDYFTKQPKSGWIQVNGLFKYMEQTCESDVAWIGFLLFAEANAFQSSMPVLSENMERVWDRKWNPALIKRMQTFAPLKGFFEWKRNVLSSSSSLASTASFPAPVSAPIVKPNLVISPNASHQTPLPIPSAPDRDDVIVIVVHPHNATNG